MRSRTGRILLIGEVSLQYSKSYNTQLQHIVISVPPIAADTEAGKRGSQMGARLRPWTHTCPKARTIYTTAITAESGGACTPDSQPHQTTTPLDTGAAISCSPLLHSTLLPILAGGRSVSCSSFAGRACCALALLCARRSAHTSLCSHELSRTHSRTGLMPHRWWAEPGTRVSRTQPVSTPPRHICGVPGHAKHAGVGDMALLLSVT